MELFDYQKNVLQQIPKTGASLVVAPTGSGKTVMFCKYVQERKLNTVVLVDREELAEQSYNTFARLNISSCIVTSKGSFTVQNGQFIKLHDHLKGGHQVYICMVETLYNRAKRHLAYKRLLENADLFIIDEAHKTVFCKLLDRYSPKQILGFTATPLFADSKKKISNYYSTIIDSIQSGELIDRGKLVKPVYYTHQVDESEIKVKTTGDFDEESVIKAYKKQSILESVLYNYKQYQQGEKTMLYCSSVDYAHEVNRYLSDNGVNCRVIDSKNTKREQRKEIFNWLSGTTDAVLINVGIATTGTDVPGCKNIILLRMITSLALYIQIVGRGARTHPGKNHFNVFDYGNNKNRLGLWEENRDWKQIIEEKEKPKKKKKVETLGLDVISFSLGVVNEVKEGDKEGVIYLQPDGSLPDNLQYILAKKWGDMDIEELQIYQKYTKKKPGWMYRQIFYKYGAQGLKAFGKLKGYSPAWAERHINNYKQS